MAAMASLSGANLDMVARGDVVVQAIDGSVSGNGSLGRSMIRAPPAFCKSSLVRHRCLLKDARVTTPVLGTSHAGRVRTIVVAQASHGSAVAERPVHKSPSSPNIEPVVSSRSEKFDHMTVADVMTSGKLVSVKEETTIDEALQALVDHRISGMPVVDDNGRLIGVVSDYDLLALDSIVGSKPDDGNIFPVTGSTWKAFKEIQKLLNKMRGKTVGDVMTPHPLVVRSMTNLEDAVRLLLESKFKRLPVVDDNGKLVGIMTRGNIVRMALQMRSAAEGSRPSSPKAL